MTTLKTANDMKFNKGDFILQHKNTAFTEIYQTDKILGQGTTQKFIRYNDAKEARPPLDSVLREILIIKHHFCYRRIRKSHEVHT